MNEVVNCSACNALFIGNLFRDVCPKCLRTEEELYQKTYEYLRKRENRAATVEQTMKATGADEQLIYKWVKNKRLQPAQFPYLFYPCDRCGRAIQANRLCHQCITELEDDLQQYEREQEEKRLRNERYNHTYKGKKVT